MHSEVVFTGLQKCVHVYVCRRGTQNLKYHSYRVTKELCAKLLHPKMQLKGPAYYNIIGASLSEPHTGGTALRKCVNIRMYVLACLQPYTVNFICTFKYFQKIEHPHALAD